MILTLTPGAPTPLPGGAAPWRVAAGEVEVYLVSAARRRLIGVIVTDGIVVGAARGLVLSLVAEHGATLEAAPQADVAEWWFGLGAPDYAKLDARFAAEDEARDAHAVKRINAGAATAEETTGLVAALARAAAALSRPLEQPVATARSTFADGAMLARLAGLRATRVILPPDWPADDRGPLLLRARGQDGQGEGQREGEAVAFAGWTARGYRDGDGNRIGPADAADWDSLAWRLFAPLTDDVSSFGGMAGSVLKGLRAELWLIVAAAVGTALLGLLVPLATGWLFEGIVPAGTGGLLLAVGIALLVAALVTACLAVARMLAISRITGRGGPNMAAGIADHVLRLPARFFKTLSAGDFNQRVESLETLRGLVTDIILSAGLTVVFSLAYLALLFAYDARLAFAGLALTLIYVASVSISRFFQIAPLREAAARSGKLAGLTFEILEGLPKLRSACAEPRALARWTAAYRAELGAQARSERIGNHFAAFADGWRILTMIGLFATAALLASGDLAAGAFIAFLIAFASFQASFTAFCEALLAIYTNAPLAERARPILHAAPEAGAGRADPGKLTGAIQASGLSFSYGAGLAPLIDGLSFDISAGEHLAIVGGSGSGKSTILRLLLGFESPTTGSLTYDGQELTSLDPSRVRAQIGVVLQSSQLFAGSIQDNIRGASHATLEQCAAAAERAGLGADLAEMPMGLHTPITEGAGTLSGGQRQRILIARAIAADPAILFFDEATSALDNLTQAIVARTLDGLGATRITIAHRLSTVRNADRICVLERGKFVETGDFETLMRAGGRFATFARRQLMEA